MKSKSKSTPDSDEERNKTRNNYTNAHRKLETILSDKDLELYLEVEMDDEVRELIKYPEKSPSTLLDVTVIKPKGLNNLYTTEKQTLNANLVKKMITSMKIDSSEKSNLMNKIFGESHIEDKSKEIKDSYSKKSGLSTRGRLAKNNKSRTSDQGDLQSVSDRLSKVISTCSQKEPKIEKTEEQKSKSLSKKIQQVYTTPRTFSNIRSLFQCTNKEDCETKGEFSCKKMNNPCHCQNCAIVGILTDSQKTPFATEEIPELTGKNNHREKRNYSPYRKRSIHKKDILLGPITSSRDSPTSTLSRFLLNIIQPLQRKSESFVKNSQHFVEILKMIKLDPDDRFLPFKHPEDAELVTPQNISNPIKDHLEYQIIFKQLSERIKHLEERVKQQEEKAVPKEYFKKIITKLVNHLTKLTHYTTLNEERESMKFQPPAKPQTNSRAKENTRYNSKYLVNHCHLDPATPVKFPAEKEYEPKPGTSTQDEDLMASLDFEITRGPRKHAEPKRWEGKNDESKRYNPENQTPRYADHPTLNESLWKWGSEVLKPGIDLKNKIVVLLEEALQNFKKNWERPAQEQKFHEDLQRFLKEISKNLPRAEKSYDAREKPRDTRHCRFTPIRESNSDSSTLNHWKHANKRSRTPALSRFIKKNRNIDVTPAKINVAYLNPAVKKWVESQVSFKIESSNDLRKQFEDEAKLYKKHFVQMIDKSKTTDKFKLWQSIWNQALAGGQNKSDSVGVQIPDPQNHQKLVTINYTIREIENLLIGGMGEEVNDKRRER